MLTLADTAWQNILYLLLEESLDYNASSGVETVEENTMCLGKKKSCFTDNMYFCPPCGLLYSPLHKLKQGSTDSVTEVQV